jgi:hypothetical protein
LSKFLGSTSDFLETWTSFLFKHKLKYSLKNYGYGPHKKNKKEEEEERIT